MGRVKRPWGRLRTGRRGQDVGSERLVVRGARQHNLKNIDVSLPRDRLIVITGLSGSGKSSLAFDTIFAEGQRRYVESLSSYARQFLGQMDKPDVDRIEGLSPAISIDQKSTSHNPRSTVGTVTEIYDYMRLLWARIGIPHCPSCGSEISSQSLDEMVDRVRALPEGTRILVLAPMVRDRKGEHQKVFQDILRRGFVRARVDGKVMDLTEGIPALAPRSVHHIDVVVDRLVVREGMRSRLADSLESALSVAEGTAVVAASGSPGSKAGAGDEAGSDAAAEDLIFSQKLACPRCGIGLEDFTPRSFSFNAPAGACPVCMGLGHRMVFDPVLLIPDEHLSLMQGALRPWVDSRYYTDLLELVAERHGFSTRVPVKELPPEAMRIVLEGSPERFHYRFKGPYGREREEDVRFPGLLAVLERRLREARTEAQREELEGYMSPRTCQACGGRRLRPEVLAVTVDGRSIADFAALSVADALRALDALPLTERELSIVGQVVREIRSRLSFLANVGLGYLTIERSAQTLSGGESQRIRLATQISSQLTGVLYILDEPSIGLHPRDNARLLDTLRMLRDLGNTVLVVEHDEETMWAADYLVDVGPGAGEAGGRIVAQGSPRDVAANPASLTGRFLSGQRAIPVPGRRRKRDGRAVTVHGAREHNLTNLTVSFPLGLFVCVTGVSGSGKSTLVNDILYPSLARTLNGARLRPGDHDRVSGAEHLDKVVDIDQAPIGRTPRSNPATYTGVWDRVREVFAQVPEAQTRGYSPGRFSFNVRGGRCEACRGDGILKIEMHFLPDVYVPCEVCRGSRYNRETLEVRYRGKNVADVLNMTVNEALELFRNQPRIARILETIQAVGLGYVRLGQPATTLSGGEAQRVKLATELSRRATGKTLYVLDEPTTGLHFEDVARLLEVLETLVDRGNTVIVIEHNLDVIKSADFIIDLGPEGGDGGGRLVAQGTPEEVALDPSSALASFLRAALGRSAPTESALCPKGLMPGTNGWQHPVPDTPDAAPLEPLEPLETRPDGRAVQGARAMAAGVTQRPPEGRVKRPKASRGPRRMDTEGMTAPA